MQKYKRKRQMSEINVVPYIDVMLVLLVIFMITTPLLTQGVKVNLPRAAAKFLAAQEPGPVIVTVDKKGSYYLNVAEHPNEPIGMRALINRVAAEIQIARGRKVLVKGDRDVAYGKVVQAMVLLQHAGVGSVGLVTTTPSNSPLSGGEEK